MARTNKNSYKPALQFHEFYSKYANTPLHKRFAILDMNRFGMKSLDMFFKEIVALEERMRPLKIEQDKLLKEVSEFM